MVPIAYGIEENKREQSGRGGRGETRRSKAKDARAVRETTKAVQSM